MWVENGRVQTLKHARLAANRNTKPKFIKVVLIDAQLKGGWSVKVLRLEDLGWARGGEKGAEKNSEKTGPFVFKRPQRMIRTELNKKLHMTRFPSHFCIRCHFILFVWERNEGEQSIWKRSAKSGEEGCWFVPFYNKNFLFTDCLDIREKTAIEITKMRKPNELKIFMYFKMIIQIFFEFQLWFFFLSVFSLLLFFCITFWFWSQFNPHFQILMCAIGSPWNYTRWLCG